MNTATVIAFPRTEARSASNFFSAGFRAKVRRAFELLATPYLVEGSRYL